MLDQVLQSGEPFFSMQYNTTFARRFSLPETKAVQLSDNLQAIAVEINKVNFQYTCDLHIYVDDQIDIYKPEPGGYYTIKPREEYFFVSEYSDKDYDWNSYVDLNLMRARFDSTLKAKYTFTSTLSYKRLHQSFLPGLTLVTLNTHCAMFVKDRYPANIWIQKQNVGDYLVGNDGPGGVEHPENNHRFPIPLGLIEQIQPYIEIAVKHNNDRL